jgi:FtsH-binding integral membrane protein
MENNQPIDYNYSGTDTGTVARTFMASVFSWMFLALAITGIISYWIGTNEELLISLMFNMETGKMSGLGYLIIFAPLGFSLLMGVAMHRLPWIAMLTVFLAFAAVMGISLATIFLMYTKSSIFMTFGICSGMYGLMAIVGFTTKTDLTKLGPIMFMGAMGIVIASVINMFMHSDSMSLIIGFIGVVVFTALTAYQVQELKRIGSGAAYGGAGTNKLALIGAYGLYITFINLFISLLRLFGSRK